MKKKEGTKVNDTYLIIFISVIICCIIAIFTTEMIFSVSKERVVKEMDMAKVYAAETIKKVNTEPRIIVVDEIEKVVFTNEHFLLAKLMKAEAEGECEEGKRLVVDTVLNRVDEGNFGSTIKEVIYQKNQYSCVDDGRFDAARVTEDDLMLVHKELEERTDWNVLYFKTKGYHSFGEDLFQIGNHYFSM